MDMHSLKHELLQKIKKYEHQILGSSYLSLYPQCPKCNQEVDFFKRHEIRSRTFQLLGQNEVERLCSLISRWKCLVCGKTITYYPDFALPYKRYILQCIMDRCSQYLEDDSQTYRRAVTRDNAEFYHQESSEDGSWPVLAHSTLHRWITSLSTLEQTMQSALEHIKQKEPHTAIFRKIAALRIPGKKFRSSLTPNLRFPTSPCLHVSPSPRPRVTQSPRHPVPA